MKRIKDKRKNICFAVLGILIMTFFVMPQAVYAGEKEGTLTVYYHVATPDEKERPLEGAEFVLYKAGEQTGNRWTLQGDFEKANIHVGDTSSSGQREAAKQLYDFAVREKLKGIRKTTQSNGKAFFDSLEEGVYLCSATADIALEGYRYHSAPFLVFVPSGEGIYHVTVEPKSEWVGRPTEPPVENPGDTQEKPDPVPPRTDTQGTRPDGVKTGDDTEIWKYVMLFAASGVLFAAGIYKRKKSLNKEEL